MLSAATGIAAVDRAVALPPATMPDDESRRFVAALRATGPAHEEAVARLHELLLRAARFEVARRRATVSGLRAGADEIAEEAAADALLAVLKRLDHYRGLSRFTTWAYKFALLEAAVKIRRREWQHREILLEPESWPLVAGHGPAAHEHAEQYELLGRLGRAIETDLTPHQRDVLVALALNGVPIDVLAARLSTTRGALYKTLHDARRRLRAAVDADGPQPATRSDR